MKYFLVIAVAALASGLHLNPPEEKAWDHFKAKHKKTYANEREENIRKQIFLTTLQEIEAFNSENHSYEQGINQFSDMTLEEIKNYLGIGALSPPTNFTSSRPLNSSPTAASKIDWRNKDGKNYVGEVRNQGSCGSCWSFSTLGSLEAMYLIHGKVNEMTHLSEQQLVDCWKKDCQGAWMWDAMDYIKDNGIVSDESYPYVSTDGNARECTMNTDSIVGHLTGYEKISNEKDLATAVSDVGPTCVTVCVPKTFFRYKTGIYDDKECNTQNSCQNLHAIVAVGYAKDHWIVKNSWGNDWGDKGYIKIARNKNRCNIGSWAVYPTV